MRGILCSGIALTALLLGACRGSSPPGAGGGGSGGGVVPKPTAMLKVSDPSGAFGPFAIASLEKLFISVEGANLKPGAHAVRVDVTSPRGSLYAQLPASLRADDQRRGSTVRTLQVRGSVIGTYREVGTWRMVAYVDGVPMAAASVDITE